MATAGATRVIDADSHVIETERTWDYLEASEQRFRPALYSSPDNQLNQYWVIDSKARGLLPARRSGHLLLAVRPLPVPMLHDDPPRPARHR